MGSAVAEMGLELQLSSMRTVVGGLVKEAKASSLGLGIESGGERGRAAGLEESIKSLEEEKRKMEAFKRELPLCMRLLCRVIRELKREIDRCRDDNFGHRFEEFMPVNGKVDRDRGVKVESDSKDKMNWLSSVQLWSNDHHQDGNEDDNNYDKTIYKEKNANLHARERKENLFFECKGRSVGGASLPLEHQSSYNEGEDKTAAQLPNLSLRSPALTPRLGGSFAEDHRFGGRKDVKEAIESSPVTTNAHFSLQSQQQPPRKARRCWSQELHRRFVLAIQQLGGAQAATPKQIREQMKVDGLTNDEVKSHLQKYRMHNRRVHNVSARASQEVGGGLWVLDDQYTTSSSQHSVSQYGSPLSPLQLASSFRALAGDSSEEDGKSESYSCKWRKTMSSFS